MSNFECVEENQLDLTDGDDITVTFNKKLNGRKYGVKMKFPNWNYLLFHIDKYAEQAKLAFDNTEKTYKEYKESVQDAV